MGDEPEGAFDPIVSFGFIIFSLDSGSARCGLGGLGSVGLRIGGLIWGCAGALLDSARATFVMPIQESIPRQTAVLINTATILGFISLSPQRAFLVRVYEVEHYRGMPLVPLRFLSLGRNYFLGF